MTDEDAVKPSEMQNKSTFIFSPEVQPTLNRYQRSL